jgi:hypothetical protein
MLRILKSKPSSFNASTIFWLICKLKLYFEHIFYSIFWTAVEETLQSRTLFGESMNPSFRIPRRLSTSLVVMHALLIALVAFVMASALPVSNLNG